MAYEDVFRGRTHQLKVIAYISVNLDLLHWLLSMMRLVDGEISGRKIQKRLQEKLHVNVSVSLINRERRRMDEHSVRSDDYSRPHESRCTAAAAACHSRDSRFV